MKYFVCRVCGHIEFIEVAGSCPVCGAPKEQFKEDPAAIKKPGDPSNKQETEKKHIPFIKIEKKCGLMGDGCTDVHVKVGEITHPMEEKHFIRYIDLYLDKKYIGRSTLSPVVMNPAACVHLKVHTGTVIALSNCNVHGNWMKEEEL